MRIGWLLFALASCLASPGCSLFVTAARDLTYEAKLRVQECFEEHRNTRLAREAFAQACPGRAASPDYASGFKTGYADYLRAGGTGLPPPLPPRHYWGYRYQTAEGHQAIDQWYAGFRDGAGAAQASGYRQFMVVPTQTVLVPPLPPPLPGVANLLGVPAELPPPQPLLTPAVTPVTAAPQTDPAITPVSAPARRPTLAAPAEPRPEDDGWRSSEPEPVLEGPTPPRP